MENWLGIRIALFVAGLLTVVTGPWWLTVLFMLLLSLRWFAFEAVFLGVLTDFSWQTSALSLSWHTWPLFTILGIIMLSIFTPVRQRFLF